MPEGQPFELRNESEAPARVLRLKRHFEHVAGLATPPATAADSRAALETELGGGLFRRKLLQGTTPATTSR